MHKLMVFYKEWHPSKLLEYQCYCSEDDILFLYHNVDGSQIMQSFVKSGINLIIIKNHQETVDIHMITKLRDNTLKY